MNRTFIRNFIIFIVVMLFCTGALIYGLVRGERSLDQTDNLVIHTHEVIIQAEEMSSLIHAMLSTQRGYLLTGDKSFLERYDDKKQNVSEHIAKLSELTSDNPSQQSRLDEIRMFFTEFSKSLEERALSAEIFHERNVLDDIEVIDGLQLNIVRLNNAILNEEYELLNDRVNKLDSKKSEYFYTLLIGIVTGTVLLLTFNLYLFRAQKAVSRSKTSLAETEERLKLAVEGTQDGIFDWDINAGTVFYSAQFFRMLGYQKDSITGTVNDFKDLLHEDDISRVWEYIEQYLSGGLSEYAQEFRMRHESGRWVWIQARAKALYDSHHKPVRMVGAHTDISHLIDAREKLAIEKKQAEAANVAKGEFLAHMSHEIRTPLTAISGIAEILEKNNNNLDDKQKQLIKTLNNSSFALKELVNDILDFSKIESGEIDLDEQMILLDKSFEEVISMMSLKANEKGVSFVFDYKDTKASEFYGDPSRLRQILVNLVGNALKFTDEGGVSVKASFEDREGTDFLRVDVTDTGIGIAPENFDLIFQRFKQADHKVNRKYGGTGLGLPISRNLAQLMGGDIFLSSEAGSGSTFTLLLPQKIENRASSEKDKNDQNHKLSDKIQSKLKGETKVLMVEDYEGNIVVIGYLLEEIGLKYDVAKTGVEALEKWSQNYYDLILMDVQMPEMDGFTATQEIRKREKEQGLNEIPIIGMTAHALVGDKDKCIEAGMTSYLPKPIIESDLKKQLLKYLDKKKKAA